MTEQTKTNQPTESSSSTSQTPYLPFFVYGTLIPGQPNDHYWEKNGASKPKSEPASLVGCQIIHLPGYPMMFETGDEKHVVKGHIVYVSEEDFEKVLPDLDLLEDYYPDDEAKSLYRRVVRKATIIGKTETVDVYTYIGLEKSSRPVIEHGDWVEWIKENPADVDWWKNFGQEHVRQSANEHLNDATKQQ